MTFREGTRPAATCMVGEAIRHVKLKRPEGMPEGTGFFLLRPTEKANPCFGTLNQQRCLRLEGIGSVTER